MLRLLPSGKFRRFFYLQSKVLHLLGTLQVAKTSSVFFLRPTEGERNRNVFIERNFGGIERNWNNKNNAMRMEGLKEIGGRG